MCTNKMIKMVVMDGDILGGNRQIKVRAMVAHVKQTTGN